MHAPYTVRVMKSLRNILDVPLPVGYVSVEFSIFWVFPYLECVFFVALFQFCFELVVVHV